jgi:FMN-dependent oxidoreductase (nitrilotriacetate monooxygenase family)
MRRQMHLGAFLFNLGNHIAGWRMPGVPADGLMSFDFYRDLAQIAEAGKFDFLFHSDGVGINDTYDAVLRHSITIRPEPLTLLSALAVVTTRIGLAATVSTTYNEPYTIARTLAMLDFLSNGRAAANLVTSSTDQEAQNFGRPRHMDHATRYARAGEFAAILRKLWDSWEDGAVILDRESGVVADPARIHAIHWEGEFFSVRGPLNMPRPPQGHPVIIQAGASEAGLDFAVRTAEVIFCVERSLESAQGFYARVLPVRPRPGARRARSAFCLGFRRSSDGPGQRRKRRTGRCATWCRSPSHSPTYPISCRLTCQPIRLTIPFPICPKPMASAAGFASCWTS